MLDYQVRVIEEKKELDIKINKLETFISEEIEVNVIAKVIKDNSLLIDQLRIMKEYSRKLDDRIKIFYK